MVKEIKEGRKYSFSFNNRKEKLYLMTISPAVAWFIDDTFEVKKVFPTYNEETLIIQIVKKPPVLVPILIMKYMNIFPEVVQEQFDV